MKRIRFDKKKIALSMLAVCCFFAIGWFDYATGTELRIFPLYFFPLIAVAWYLGKSCAILASLLATLLWVLAMYHGGRHYEHAYIWVVNTGMQSFTFIFISLMIVYLRQALSKEQHFSRTDLLTGLVNKRGLIDQTGPMVTLLHRQQRPVTLAYLDLDNFKKANDTLGHAYGDNLLRITSDIFLRSLRMCDICSRVGGDEFIILMPETTGQSAQIVLERIRLAIAVHESFQHIGVTASIGAINFNKAPICIEDLIIQADKIMYRVKGGGKNHVHIEYSENNQNDCAEPNSILHYPIPLRQPYNDSKATNT